MPETAAISQAIAALFECEVGVGVTDPRAAQPSVLAGEDLQAGRVVPARLREFAAGRAAARQAMAALGLPPAAIPVRPTRDPLWPAGLAGSISHSKTLCVAVLTRADMCIGLDLEPDRALEPFAFEEVLGIPATTPLDHAARREGTLIFCAKEAAYKAQFPISGKVLGFDAMQIDFQAQGVFEARFVKPAALFELGARLPGRHTLVADHFATAVSIERTRVEGPQQCL